MRFGISGALLLPSMALLKVVPPQRLDLAPDVARAVKAYARGMAARTADNIIIDTASYAHVAGALGLPMTTETAVSSTTGMPVQFSTGRGNVHCKSAVGCATRGNGLLVTFDAVSLDAPGRASVYAALRWTYRRKSGQSAIGRHELRLTFVKNASGWTLRDATPVGLFQS